MCPGPLLGPPVRHTRVEAEVEGAAEVGCRHHRVVEEAEVEAAEGCCRSQTCASPFVMSVMRPAPGGAADQTLSDQTPLMAHLA